MENLHLKSFAIDPHIKTRWYDYQSLTRTYPNMRGK
jgi:hypothetical protein